MAKNPKQAQENKEQIHKKAIKETVKKLTPSTSSKSTTSAKSQTKKTQKASTNRKYLTAICITGGIITLIDEDGELRNYRQRGITSIPDEYKQRLIGLGVLNNKWFMYKELPRDISISYEDSSYLGKASATFPIKRLMSLVK